MGAKMQLRSRSVEDEPRFVVGMKTRRAMSMPHTATISDIDVSIAFFHVRINASVEWSHRLLDLP